MLKIANRRAAEAALFRPKVTLRCPPDVKENLVAHQYWKNTIKRMKGISLLDDLDTDILAAYCLQSARRDLLAKLVDEGKMHLLGKLQSQERLILSYAGKLGLTAESRVRLAKKKAEGRQVEEQNDDPLD